LKKLIWTNWISLFLVAALFNSVSVVGADVKSMKLLSSAFQDNGSIPKKYTCEGNDVSPPLTILDIPQGTKSLALIIEDPDSFKGTFDHWIVWNIPPTQLEIVENVSFKNQGVNGFGDNSYRGPCPPEGKLHRYFFKLYALDIELNLPKTTTKEKLIKEMEKHVLEKAELVGTYAK
jgi:Raf kinase inhibitor-like YbhB/YbcL family protein